MINITDTARVLYKNAYIRAWNYAEKTTRLSFFAPDGTSLGDTLYTDAEGYIVYNNGQQRTNGCFVKSQAIIEVSFDNVHYNIQWVTETGLSEVVHDGKLIDVNGNVVWTSMSDGNYELDYNALKNKPRFNIWNEKHIAYSYESENDVHITIPANATVITIYAPPSRSQGLTVHIDAPVRAGQQVIIQGDSPMYSINVYIPGYTEPLIFGYGQSAIRHGVLIYSLGGLNGYTWRTTV